MFTGKLKYKNTDSTKILNDRFKSIGEVGFITGSDINATYSNNKLEIVMASPSLFLSYEGMIVEGEGGESSIIQAAPSNSYIVYIHAEYKSNTDPLIYLSARNESSPYTPNDYHIVIGKVTLDAGGNETVTYNNGDRIDILKRSIIRGSVTGISALPGIDPSATGFPASFNPYASDAKFVKNNDVYLIETDKKFVVSNISGTSGEWSEATFASLSDEVSSHRMNYYTDEKHLTDEQFTGVSTGISLPIEVDSFSITNPSMGGKYPNIKLNKQTDSITTSVSSVASISYQIPTGGVSSDEWTWVFVGKQSTADTYFKVLLGDTLSNIKDDNGDEVTIHIYYGSSTATAGIVNPKSWASAPGSPTDDLGFFDNSSVIDYLWVNITPTGGTNIPLKSIAGSPNYTLSIDTYYGTKSDFRSLYDNTPVTAASVTATYKFLENSFDLIKVIKNNNNFYDTNIKLDTADLPENYVVSASGVISQNDYNKALDTKIKNNNIYATTLPDIRDMSATNSSYGWVAVTTSSDLGTYSGNKYFVARGEHPSGDIDLFSVGQYGQIETRKGSFRNPEDVNTEKNITVLINKDKIDYSSLPDAMEYRNGDVGFKYKTNLRQKNKFSYIEATPRYIIECKGSSVAGNLHTFPSGINIGSSNIEPFYVGIRSSGTNTIAVYKGFNGDTTSPYINNTFNITQGLDADEVGNLIYIWGAPSGSGITPKKTLCKFKFSDETYTAGGIDYHCIELLPLNNTSVSNVDLSFMSTGDEFYFSVISPEIIGRTTNVTTAYNNPASGEKETFTSKNLMSLDDLISNVSNSEYGVGTLYTSKLQGNIDNVSGFNPNYENFAYLLRSYPIYNPYGGTIPIESSGNNSQIYASLRMDGVHSARKYQFINRDQNGNIPTSAGRKFEKYINPLHVHMSHSDNNADLISQPRRDYGTTTGGNTYVCLCLENPFKKSSNSSPFAISLMPYDGVTFSYPVNISSGKNSDDVPKKVRLAGTSAINVVYRYDGAALNSPDLDFYIEVIDSNATQDTYYLTSVGSITHTDTNERTSSFFSPYEIPYGSSFSLLFKINDSTSTFIDRIEIISITVRGYVYDSTVQLI